MVAFSSWRRCSGCFRSWTNFSPTADIKDHNLPTPWGKILPHLDVEIVKRSDGAVGFKIIPKRWIVERTIAWLNRCRRLAKDWENLNRKALAFLRLASIRLMLRKLCNPG